MTVLAIDCTWTGIDYTNADERELGLAYRMKSWSEPEARQSGFDEPHKHVFFKFWVLHLIVENKELPPKTLLAG